MAASSFSTGPLLSRCLVLVLALQGLSSLAVQQDTAPLRPAGLGMLQEERKEISVWLSGYFGMVKLWVDKILDNEDHDIDKNKIITTLTTWIKYLEDERQKIMLMKDRVVEPDSEIRPVYQQERDGIDEG